MECKSCVYHLKVISRCEECIHCSARRTEIPAVDNYEESDIYIGKEIRSTLNDEETSGTVSKEV
jgi:hypothetical protein